MLALSPGIVRYEEIAPGNANVLHCNVRFHYNIYLLVGNSLFTVQATGTIAGHINVTGTLDREEAATHAISVRVSEIIIWIHLLSTIRLHL